MERSAGFRIALVVLCAVLVAMVGFLSYWVSYLQEEAAIATKVSASLQRSANVQNLRIASSTATSTTVPTNGR
jgi:hypothetical protein